MDDSVDGLRSALNGLSPDQRFALACTLMLASGALTVASAGAAAPGLLALWQVVGLLGGAHGIAFGAAGLSMSIASGLSGQDITANSRRSFKAGYDAMMNPLAGYRSVESARKVLAPRGGKDVVQAISSELLEELLLEPAEGGSRGFDYIDATEHVPLVLPRQTEIDHEKIQAVLAALEALERFRNRS